MYKFLPIEEVLILHHTNDIIIDLYIQLPGYTRFKSEAGVTLFTVKTVAHTRKNKTHASS